MRTENGDSVLRQSFSGVQVKEIQAPAASDVSRLAVQIRNELMYDMTGGDAPRLPTHRLDVKIGGGNTVIVQGPSQLPNIENYGLNATYVLTEIATGKVVVTGTTFSRVYFDPSGRQRLARFSGLHDAERRAAKEISTNITTRLASYFSAGT